MKKRTLILKGILLSAIALVPLGGKHCSAETFDQFLKQNDKAKMRYEKAAPEDRAKMKEKWEMRQEKFESLPADQQEKIKARVEKRKADAEMRQEKRKELKEKWENLTDEQKARIKENREKGKGLKKGFRPKKKK